MSLWNKLWNNCKIIITENKKVDETNITEISRCVSLNTSSLEVQNTNLRNQEKSLNEETKVEIHANNRHPVTRNMSVSRSGRCRQKLKRRSVLFDIPELVSYNINESKITSIDSKLPSIDLNLSKDILMASESESENQVPVNDLLKNNE
jgi:hypothetical protein